MALDAVFYDFLGLSVIDVRGNLGDTESEVTAHYGCMVRVDL